MMTLGTIRYIHKQHLLSSSSATQQFLYLMLLYMKIAMLIFSIYASGAQQYVLPHQGAHMCPIYSVLCGSYLLQKFKHCLFKISLRALHTGPASP